MRLLLLTGKGGVGKTTLAAATALHAARRGTKTLLLSLAAPHSTGDALGLRLLPEPVELETGLSACLVDPAPGRIGEVLEGLGMRGAAAADALDVPLAADLKALRTLRDHVASGPWDLIVADCPPTAETLRLLTLPSTLSAVVARAFPVERRVARLLARRGRPRPDAVVDAVDLLGSMLSTVREVLSATSTTVRLVTTPETLTLADARRAWTALSLNGFAVDGVLVNRVAGPGWRRSLRAGQSTCLDEVASSFAQLRPRTVAWSPVEPVGAPALAALGAAAYGDEDPCAGAEVRVPHTVERSGHELVLVIALPLVSRADVVLERHGDELVVAVGAAPRVVVPLPSALQRCTVAGAHLRDGALRVRFEPDPALWRSL